MAVEAVSGELPEVLAAPHRAALLIHQVQPGLALARLALVLLAVMQLVAAGQVVPLQTVQLIWALRPEVVVAGALTI